MKEYYVGSNFNAEAGYVPRTDFIHVNPRATFKFFPKNSKLEYHGFLVELDNFYSPGDMELTDRKINANYLFQFKNRAHMEIKSDISYVVLRKDYDPTGLGVNYLLSGTNYNWSEASLLYTSDNSKLFNMDSSRDMVDFTMERNFLYQGI